VNLAAPLLEQGYRYPLASDVVPAGDGRRLRLATSGGPVANPRFFRGRLVDPLVAADLLLTLGDVARARFHVPPAMLVRILELADPIATCGDDRLRFEAFSACCSVYGRVDLLPGAVDGDVIGRGTTNVDFGPGIRAALAAIHGGTRLDVAVGLDEIEIRADDAVAVERRVPLPSRWLRGLLEVQTIQAGLRPSAELGGPAARAFIRSVPRAATKRLVWITADGRSLRIVHHDAGRGAIGVAGLQRLRLLERVARHATAIRVYAADDDGSTGWQLDVPGARLTLILSPETWRGFSGEGRALHRLADGAPPAAVAAVRGHLGWQARLDGDGLAAATGRPGDETEAALASLALSGIVGFDLADGGYYRRELPFDLARIERLQPRLRQARAVVQAGAVEVASTLAVDGWAWVHGSGGVDYRVGWSKNGWTCTCPWYGQHRGDRGPCKHVLAVQIVTLDDAG
jgi:hypothetical protein